MSIKNEIAVYKELIYGMKTKGAVKGFLTKSLKRAQLELKDRKDFEKEGKLIFLGSPIYPQIRALEDEIIAIKRLRLEYF